MQKIPDCSLTISFCSLSATVCELISTLNPCTGASRWESPCENLSFMKTLLRRSQKQAQLNQIRSKNNNSIQKGRTLICVTVYRPVLCISKQHYFQFFSCWKMTYIQWSGEDNLSVINLTKTVRGSALSFPLIYWLYLIKKKGPIIWAGCHHQYPMWRALCRSHLRHRHRLRWCDLSHLYSCTSQCHWHSSLWLSVCCSLSERDVWNCTAPPSLRPMKSIVGDWQVSNAAGHDLWQKSEWDNIRQWQFWYR